MVPPSVSRVDSFFRQVEISHTVVRNIVLVNQAAGSDSQSPLSFPMPTALLYFSGHDSERSTERARDIFILSTTTVVKNSTSAKRCWRGFSEQDRKGAILPRLHYIM